MRATRSHLQQQCIDLYRIISSPDSIDHRHLETWFAFEEAVSTSARQGSLDSETASDISSLVNNVRIIATTRAALEQDSDLAMKTLSESLENIALGHEERESAARESADDVSSTPEASSRLQLLGSVSHVQTNLSTLDNEIPPLPLPSPHLENHQIPHYTHQHQPTRPSPHLLPHPPLIPLPVRHRKRTTLQNSRNNPA